MILDPRVRAIIFVCLIFTAMKGSLIAMAVKPFNLAESLRETAAPPGKLGLPIDRFMLLFFLTFLFVPIIFQQATGIKEAQIARGMSMGKGIVNVFRKAIPLMIPLFAMSISRAEQLSLVLEARGYNSPLMRTSLKKFRLSFRDYTMAIAVITITAFID